MINLKQLGAAGIPLALLAAASPASAEPRAIRVQPDGTSVDIDYKTSNAADRSKKDRPNKGKGGGKTDPVASDLPPLDLSDMALWNWQGLWHASEWDNAFSDIPFRYNHISQSADGNTTFSLDSSGAPELKGQNQPTHIAGLWEVDVSLPDAASGLNMAPLWLYNGDNGDEIDFEFVGTKGLQVTIHSYNSGSHAYDAFMLLNSSSLAGQRVRLGIRADLTAGWIDMLVNGQVAHSFHRSDSPNAFPTTGLKPVLSMWTAKSGLGWAEQWLGTWNGGSATMVVHGYQYTPL